MVVNGSGEAYGDQHMGSITNHSYMISIFEFYRGRKKTPIKIIITEQNDSILSKLRKE